MAALAVDDAADCFADFRDAAGVLIAVSGGPDSVALMHLLAAWASRDGAIPLFVATVDHGLRPEGRREAEAVAETAANLSLPHAILDWTGVKPAARLQEAARTARYALLTDHARAVGATHLATAHTLDDQAETVMFRLARGSGPKGLAGMRRRIARRGVLHVRPFLHLRKARLVATCAANDWAYCADPSNTDPRFARTRWRALLPALEREGLTPERIAVLSARILRGEAALDAAAEALHARIARPSAAFVETIDGSLLMREPEELIVRVVARALASVVAPENRPAPRLDRLEAFCGALRRCLLTQAPFRRTLAGALVTLRPDGAIMVVREPPRATPAS